MIPRFHRAVCDYFTPRMLQSPCVVAIIGELKTTGMAQHVWVDRERHLGDLPDTLIGPPRSETNT
jgi:hypothetical protein